MDNSFCKEKVGKAISTCQTTWSRYSAASGRIRFIFFAAEASGTHTDTNQQKSRSGDVDWDMPPLRLPATVQPQPSHRPAPRLYRRARWLSRSRIRPLPHRPRLPQCARACRAERVPGRPIV